MNFTVAFDSWSVFFFFKLFNLEQFNLLTALLSKVHGAVPSLPLEMLSNIYILQK